MSNKMIIDSSHPEETRVVVVKGNRLEEFDFESQHKRQIRGNIYLAKVTRVEPSLQAAFVDYGGNRHGFLAFSEIHPDYYQIPLADRQALVEEEAALAAQADEDEEQEEAPNGRGKRGRRRRGRGRRGGNGRVNGAHVPAAEPVAMEAILADWDDRQADDGPAEASDDDETVAETDAVTDDDTGTDRSIAAAADSAADDVVSQAIDDDDDADDSDDDEDGGFDDVGEDDAIEDSRPRRRPSRRQYKIQEVIKRRQVLLVQVVKEERGNKGAALTTYMSLAGRYSVLMPNTARGGGISRKITASADRKRLKDLVRKLDVPKGMGVILRTAGANRTQSEIERDYEYLMRLWDNVRDLTLSSAAPTLVYEEGSLIKRSIRDLYNKDIGEVVVAGEAGYREAKDFMKMLMPGQTGQVKPWKDTAPILARTGIEAQLDKLIHPQVTLKSGGYIIINQTEALVAIDVNSGKSTREHSIEKTALATNLEAAEEVARQLRLRDLAGLIVIDFIDMEENRNNRAVEKKLKDCLKHDRARIQVGRISHFGLLEMSRQRMRASVLESTMQVCSTCGGTGYVRSPQSVALHVIRSLEEHLLRNSRFDVTVRTSGDTALYILNNKRDTLAEMEARFGVAITIAIDNEIGIDMLAIDRGAVSDRPKQTNGAVAIGDWGDEDDDAVAADDDADTAIEAREGADDVDDDEDGRSKRRKRRRRRGREQRGETEATETEARAGEDEGDDEDDTSGGRRRKRRSRGRRGGRNRRGPRIPAAEPIGPLADLIAAEAEAAAQAAEAEAAAAAAADAEMPSPEDEKAEDPAVAAAPPAAANGEAHDDVPAEATEIESDPDEAAAEPAMAADAATDSTAEDTGAEDAVDADDTADAETADAERTERVRATEQTLNLDVEPVIVSDSADEAPRKKRAGWWARGKSWF